MLLVPKQKESLRSNGLDPPVSVAHARLIIKIGKWLRSSHRLLIKVVVVEEERFVEEVQSLLG